MAVNRKCPKCGSDRVQLSNERSKHGCFFFLIFGIFYLVLVAIKWVVGAVFFALYDWWMAIIKSTQKKGYAWHSRKWFSGNKRLYYCHNCGYNFKA